jgi:hypothetical protein
MNQLEHGRGVERPTTLCYQAKGFLGRRCPEQANAAGCPSAADTNCRRERRLVQLREHGVADFGYF